MSFRLLNRLQRGIPDPDKIEIKQFRISDILVMFLLISVAVTSLEAMKRFPYQIAMTGSSFTIKSDQSTVSCLLIEEH